MPSSRIIGKNSKLIKPQKADKEKVEQQKNRIKWHRYNELRVMEEAVLDESC